MSIKKPISATLPRVLMARMGHALGLNLAKAQHAGLLCPDTVARMHHHCSACADPRACTDLLYRFPDHLDKPPRFCPNRSLMLSLRRME
ncbi:MAG: hypothetical protein GY717_12090 [Rhodobacteraceae bacterium]|nr:hypothetical protein [Paracoccaceae bacterium]